MSKWQEFLMWSVTKDNDADPDFHFCHPNPLVKPYSKEAFREGLKDSFKSIKFSTRQEILKKLPKYLPGIISCFAIGIVMLRTKWTSSAAAGVVGCIPIILIVVGAITLASLFLNITIFDKKKS